MRTLHISRRVEPNMILWGASLGCLMNAADSQLNVVDVLCSDVFAIVSSNSPPREIILFGSNNHLLFK